MKASEIKKEARVALTGKWRKAACIALVYLALSFIITYTQELVEVNSNISDIIGLLYFIINIPLSFGLLISFIKLRRGEEVKAFDFLGEGFSRFKKSWGIWAQTLLKLLLPTICLIVLIILMSYLVIASVVDEVAASSLLVVMILLIVAYIYMMIKALLYVLAYNISYDNPELSAKECVNKSAKLMKGKRVKYFLLELSFIGWAILSALTFGIGMIWLLPYMQVSMICFYEKSLKQEEEKVQEVIDTKE